MDVGQPAKSGAIYVPDSLTDAGAPACHIAILEPAQNSDAGRVGLRDFVPAVALFPGLAETTGTILPRDILQKIVPPVNI